MNIFYDLTGKDSLAILLWLLGAWLLGLLLGWLLWGRKYAILAAELENRNKELEALRVQYNTLQSQFDLKDADLKKTQLELNELRDRNHHLEEEKGQLHGDLYAAKDSISQLQTENEAAMARISELSAKLGIEVSPLLANLEAENAALREELEDKAVGQRLTADAGDAGMHAGVIVSPDGWSSDDLKVVEGIGPKIAELLNDAGIHYWGELANTSVDRLREVLDAAGEHYRIHDPSTWPKQAQLLNDGKWDEFKEYTEYLQGGKDPS